MNLFKNKWPAILLWPLSLLYGTIVTIRNVLYELKTLPVYHPGCKVISIGNITVGGTGKTPTVITIAQYLMAKNARVCVISRGYGRKSKGTIIVSDGAHITTTVEQAGDEPLMIAKKLPGATVIVDSDRVRAAKYAMQYFQPDYILLDDGFQHRRIARDVNIVTLNKRFMFGNRFLLPAGPLREPLFNLKRADLFWVNAADKESFDSLPLIKTEQPIITGYYNPLNLVNKFGKSETPDLKNIKVIAFSGLGNPDNFKHTLEQLGAQVVMFIRFKDHHDYTDKDLKLLEKTLASQSSAVLITTEKDWIKLPDSPIITDQWKYLSMNILPSNLQVLDVFLAKKSK